jgi:hypothetical protein
MLFFPSFPCFFWFSPFIFLFQRAQSGLPQRGKQECLVVYLTLDFWIEKYLFAGQQSGEKKATIGQTWRFSRQKIAVYLQSWLLRGNPMIKTYTVTDFNLQL